MKFIKPKPEQIAAWIESNFDYKTRKNGSEYIINNPFDYDTGFHFNINVDKGICHDWRGNDWAKGSSKTFLKFVQLYRNCSFTDAIKEICGNDISIKALYDKLKNRDKEGESEYREDDITYDIKLPDGSSRLCDDTTSLGSILTNWLHTRGILDDKIKQYDLYYTGTSIVWPYYEYGSLVYWQKRDRLNKMFLFPPDSVGVTKGMFLYGFDMAEPSQYVIINESIIDSMTLGSQALASGGAILTDLQVRKIRSLNPVDGVILAPDNDKAGIASIISNYKLLYPYFKLFYSIPPSIEYDGGKTKDWNDLGKVMPWTNIRDIFNNSVKKLGQADVIKLMVNL